MNKKKCEGCGTTENVKKYFDNCFRALCENCHKISIEKDTTHWDG